MASGSLLGYTLPNQRSQGMNDFGDIMKLLIMMKMEGDSKKSEDRLKLLLWELENTAQRTKESKQLAMQNQIRLPEFEKSDNYKSMVEIAELGGKEQIKAMTTRIESENEYLGNINKNINDVQRGFEWIEKMQHDYADAIQAPIRDKETKQQKIDRLQANYTLEGTYGPSIDQFSGEMKKFLDDFDTTTPEGNAALQQALSDFSNDYFLQGIRRGTTDPQVIKEKVKGDILLEKSLFDLERSDIEVDRAQLGYDSKFFADQIARNNTARTARGTALNSWGASVMPNLSFVMKNDNSYITFPSAQLIKDSVKIEEFDRMMKDAKDISFIKDDIYRMSDMFTQAQANEDLNPYEGLINLSFTAYSENLEMQTIESEMIEMFGGNKELMNEYLTESTNDPVAQRYQKLLNRNDQFYKFGILNINEQDLIRAVEFKNLKRDLDDELLKLALSGNYPGIASSLQAEDNVPIAGAIESGLVLNRLSEYKQLFNQGQNPMDPFIKGQQLPLNTNILNPSGGSVTTASAGNFPGVSPGALAADVLTTEYDEAKTAYQPGTFAFDYPKHQFQLDLIGDQLESEGVNDYLVNHKTQLNINPYISPVSTLSVDLNNSLNKVDVEILNNELNQRYGPIDEDEIMNKVVPFSNTTPWK